MCPAGCNIDPDTRLCRACGRTLQALMDLLQVPKADQDHTVNWLIYHHYQ
jgi:predicted Fe-S protein YdhL (DUF1289 family)